MKHTIYLDLNRCTGCYACVVACMDQNDLQAGQGQPLWRQIFIVEDGTFPDVKVTFVSMACMHCQEAPCLRTCPAGAIKKEAGVILVNQDLCIGCYSCSMACPFGVPRFGQDGKMQKCNLCIARVEAGLEPACTRICPTGALKFGEINEMMMQAETNTIKRLVNSRVTSITRG